MILVLMFITESEHNTQFSAKLECSLVAASMMICGGIVEVQLDCCYRLRSDKFQLSSDGSSDHNLVFIVPEAV